jgi:hypothetical protein
MTHLAVRIGLEVDLIDPGSGYRCAGLQIGDVCAATNRMVAHPNCRATDVVTVMVAIGAVSVAGCRKPRERL